MDTLDRAEAFLWVNARLLDRLRFAFHFRDGDPATVIDALRPYGNADGGFGHALEPDLRGPESQPVPVELALFVMDEVGTLDADLLDGILRYLESITRPDGGVPWVLPTTSPRGPWWTPVTGLPGSLNPTASIAGLLLKNGVEHPWVERATGFCWTALDNLNAVGAYDVRTIVKFLEHVPDRSRAEATWAALSESVRSVIDLDPAADGDVHGPLDFAPHPDSLARSLFDGDVIDRHLDALRAKQKADGGWDFTFESWTPITRPEWRGWVTLESLLTLRSNGRL
ncbi:hypothetical protein GCM10010435_66940 [Winogradskya consettensis]|uniref:Uncharacterized protein n=1 Tax=Winogradskya consettensis TaxID=113560 RepID=A0A919SLG8_9ACTN|nr:hypothetical protein [Actinoplanes consettensis]GIM73919.1 hypothetical protein Aco04nite_37820 [Actinoplanes consettensis]